MSHVLTVLWPCHSIIIFAFHLRTMDLRVVPSRSNRHSTLQSVRQKLWQKWRHASYGPDTDGHGATSVGLTFDFAGDTTKTSYWWLCLCLYFPTTWNRRTTTNFRTSLAWCIEINNVIMSYHNIKISGLRRAIGLHRQSPRMLCQLACQRVDGLELLLLASAFCWLFLVLFLRNRT